MSTREMVCEIMKRVAVGKPSDVHAAMQVSKLWKDCALDGMQYQSKEYLKNLISDMKVQKERLTPTIKGTQIKIFEEYLETISFISLPKILSSTKQMQTWYLLYLKGFVA